MKKLIQSQLAKLQQGHSVFHSKSKTLTFGDQDLQQAELERQLENIDFSYEMLKKGKLDTEQLQLIMGAEQTQIMPLFHKRASYQNRNQTVYKEKFIGSSTQAVSSSNSFKESKDKDSHVIIPSSSTSGNVKTSSIHPNYLPKNTCVENQKARTRTKSAANQKSTIAIQEEPSQTLDKIQATDLANTRAFLESINDISNIENVNAICNAKSHHCKTQASLQCTFKPKILKKSLQIAQNLPDSFDRLTHVKKETKNTYHQPPQRKFSHTRIQRLSQPRKLPQKEQQALPSFKPNLSKTKISYQGGAVSSADVINRNQIWLQQKQKKIQKLRRQEEQQKRKIESTVHIPRIKQYKGQNDVNLSNFGKQGIANYFQRVNAAKNMGTKGISSNTSSNLNISMSKSSTLKTIKSKQNQKQKDAKKQGKKTYQAALKDLHWKIQNLKI